LRVSSRGAEYFGEVHAADTFDYGFGFATSSHRTLSRIPLLVITNPLGLALVTSLRRADHEERADYVVKPASPITSLKPRH
jgi:hypothetical protein